MGKSLRSISTTNQSYQTNNKVNYSLKDLAFG